MSTDGSITIKALLDTAGLTSGLKETENNLIKFGSNATKYVTTPFVNAATEAINLASDMQETTSKIDSVFGNSADAMMAWSETTIETLGLAGQTALDMTANYGDMATSFGFTQQAAADMGQELVSRAADLASFKNISIDVANTALSGVFTGETESLKQLGVVMTQANLDAFALEQGLSKTTSEMSQQELVALRLDYVMQATSNAAGDFARTSDSTANQTRVATQRLKEMGTSFGKLLLPMANKALSVINKVLTAFTKMSTKGKKTVLVIAGIAAAIGPATTGITKFYNATKSLSDGFKSVKKFFTTFGAMGEEFASSMVTATMATSAKTKATIAQGTAEKGVTVALTKKQLAQAANTTAEVTGTTVTAANTAELAANAGVISLKSVLVGVLNGQIGIVTAAQMIWNAAMEANPIFLVVAVIAAVATGLVLLTKKLWKNTEAEAEAKKEKEALIEANEKLRESIEESAEAYEDTVKSLETEGAAINKLVGNLEQLEKEYQNVDKNSEEAKRIQAEMQVCVNTLNGSVEDLNLSIDEETGLLNKNIKLIKKETQAYELSLKQKVKEERYLELIEEQYAAQKTCLDTQEEILDIEKQIANGTIRKGKGNKWIKQLKEELVEASTTCLDLLPEVNAVKEDLAELNIEAQEVDIELGLEQQQGELQALADEFGMSSEAIQEAVEESGQSTEDWASSQREQIEQLQELSDEFGMTTEAIAEAASASGMSIEDWSDSQREYLQEVEDCYTSLKDTATNAFEKIDRGQSISISTMITNLNTNSAAVKEWSDGLAFLAEKGIDQGFLQTLRDMGPESVNLVSSMVGELSNGRDELVDEFNTAFADSGQAGFDAWETTVASTEFKNIPAEAVEEAAGKVDADTSLETSITNTMIDAVTAATSYVEQFGDVGKQMMTGMAAGVTDNAHLVSAAVAQAVKNAIATAKATSDQASPSKKFRAIGRYDIEGYRLGWIDNMDSTFSNIQTALDKNQNILQPAYAAVDNYQRRAALSAQSNVSYNNVYNSYSQSADTNQDVNVTVGIDPDMSKFARILYPYIKDEQVRRGDNA